MEQRIYRTFGTAFEGDRLNRGLGTESPFNVNVVSYRGRLLAFGEQSLPMELDSDTLETLTPGQTFNFDRTLNDSAPFSRIPRSIPAPMSLSILEFSLHRISPC